MTIAADARYRAVSIDFNNNEAEGGETIQLLARPSGGDWAAVRSVAVAGSAQHIEWDTAVPLTAYELAMRYLNGIVPGVGYEGYDPDAWTASTAAGAKSTVTTTSAAVSGLSGIFLGPSVPVVLTWASAQQGVPYLLEKDVGAGYVTVASGIVGTTYLYTVVAGEPGTTVAFRVTAQRGSIAGPSSTANVLMELVVGAPTITSTVWDPFTGVVTLIWSAASLAIGYQLQKSTDGGASWTLIASPAVLTYVYTALEAEYNTTLKFRVRGTNEAVVGDYSATAEIALTFVLTAPVISAPFGWQPAWGLSTTFASTIPLAPDTFVWGFMGLVIDTFAPAATSYTPQYSVDGGVTWVDVVTRYNYDCYAATPLLNIAVQWRMLANRAGVASIPSNVLTITPTWVFTAVITSAVLVGDQLTITWTGSTPALLSFYVSGLYGYFVTTILRSSGVPFLFSDTTPLVLVASDAGASAPPLSLPVAISGM